MIVRALHFFIFKLKYSCKTNLISHLKAIFGTHCSTEPLVPGSHAIWMCEIFSPSGHLWYYRFNPVSQRHDGSSAVPSCTGAFFKPVDIVQKSFHTFHFWKQVVKLEYFYSGICCNFILGCHSFFFHPPTKKRNHWVISCSRCFKVGIQVCTTYFRPITAVGHYVGF